jgi:uncharacterized membrane protein
MEDSPPGPAPAATRVVAFDVARGVAVLGMILIHVQRHWADPGPWPLPLSTVISVLGGPFAAPVFMLLMGASVAWSSRTSARAMARRGLLLLAGGLALNLVRGTVPLLLGQAAGVIGPEGVGIFTPWSLLVTVDVLQLAGMSLLVVAALRPVVRHDAGWIALAVLVAVVAPMLRDLRTGVLPLDGLLGLLWATGPSVYYPLFPWGAFPLLGVALGRTVRADPDGATLRWWGLAGVVMGVTGGVILGPGVITLDERGYWALAPALAGMLAGVALAWTWVCRGIARVAGSTAPVALMARWGRRVTRIYVVHWLIVAWGVGVVGYLALPFWPSVLAMILVVAATHVLAVRLAPGNPKVARHPGSASTV